MSMSVAAAAELWEQSRATKKEAEEQEEAAKAVLLEYFRSHPDKREYKGRIGYSREVQARLDTAKVKLELAGRLDEFQKAVEVERITLLR